MNETGVYLVYLRFITDFNQYTVWTPMITQTALVNKLKTVVKTRGKILVETILDVNDDVFYRRGQGLYAWVTREQFLAISEHEFSSGSYDVKFGQYGTHAEGGSTPQDTILSYVGTTVSSVVILYAIRLSDEQIAQVGNAYTIEQLVAPNLGQKSQFGTSREVFATNIVTVEEEVNKILYPHIFDVYFYTKKLTYRPRLRQQEAIDKFYRYYQDTISTGTVNFLLGAIPRFGKSFTFLEMAKKVIPPNGNILVITGRPDVFESLKYDIENHEAFTTYQYDELKELKYNWRPSTNKVNVLAVSTQLLVNKKHRKKLAKYLSQFTWDIRGIDEADTTMLTEQSQELLEELNAPVSIWITGTYWKLVNTTGMFSETKNIYTYDYIQQQQDKKDNIDPRAVTLNWYVLRVLDKITDHQKWYTDDEGFTLTKLFGFNEETQTFVHEGDVVTFLQCVFGNIPRTKFSPYKIIPNLRHTFWVLPPSTNGVLRLKELIENITKGEFTVFAATGNDVDDIAEVKDFLRWNKDKKTIVLSINRFTRGTTVPEWNATFFLSDTESAELYFQAAFRPASPAEGKDCGYVFDWNPNRTLTMTGEYCTHSAQQRGITDPTISMREFLDNFNIFGIDDGVEFRKQTLEDILRAIRESDYPARTLRNSGPSYITLHDSMSDTLFDKLMTLSADSNKTMKHILTSSRHLTKKGKNYKTTKTSVAAQRKKDQEKTVMAIIATLMSRLPIICELGYRTVEEIIEKLPDELFYGATNAEKEILRLLVAEKIIDTYKVNLQLV